MEAGTVICCFFFFPFKMVFHNRATTRRVGVSLPVRTARVLTDGKPAEL